MIEPLHIVAGLGMIGFLVLIHEAGHFIVAKMFGVGVPVFSIGMGPRIFGFAYKGTDYRISAIPVGGYVMLAGADPYGEEDVHASVAPEEDFMKKPVWQRLLVMAAGPGVNILLPILLFTAVLMGGEPSSAAVVGAVLPGSPAEDAGLTAGDTVTAIDGEPVLLWMDVVEGLERHKGDAGDVVLSIQRAGEAVTLEIPRSELLENMRGGLDTDALGVSYYRVSPRVGVGDPGSPAHRAGLLTGDAIVSVDGESVDDWGSLQGLLSGDAPHELVVSRGGPAVGEDGEPVEIKLTLPPVSDWNAPADEAWTDAYGMAPALLFAFDVQDGGPAARAGVVRGDRFLTVDGRPVRSFSHFIELVGDTVDGRDNPRPLELVVLRDGERSTMTMTPRVELVPSEVYVRPIIGVQTFGGTLMSGPQAVKYYSVIEAVPRALNETWMLLEMTVATIGNMFAGRADPADNLGGPVAMFSMAGTVAEYGLFTFVRWTGMFSISVGVINLLPVPVLDGGQILFYLAEAIRGRPLPLELRERLQMGGVMLMLALMLFVTINDISRIWAG